MALADQCGHEGSPLKLGKPWPPHRMSVLHSGEGKEDRNQRQNKDLCLGQQAATGCLTQANVTDQSRRNSTDSHRLRFGRTRNQYTQAHESNRGSTVGLTGW